MSGSVVPTTKANANEVMPAAKWSPTKSGSPALLMGEPSRFRGVTGRSARDSCFAVGCENTQHNQYGHTFDGIAAAVGPLAQLSDSTGGELSAAR